MCKRARIGLYLVPGTLQLINYFPIAFFLYTFDLAYLSWLFYKILNLNLAVKTFSIEKEQLTEIQ